MMTDNFWAPILAQSDMDYLTGLFSAGPDGSVQHLSSSAVAYLLRCLYDSLDRPLICVTDGPRIQDLLYQDIVTLFDKMLDDVGYYPGWESLPHADIRPHSDLVGDRLAILLRYVAKRPPKLLVTTIQAMMQRTIDPETLSEKTIRLTLHEEKDLEKLTEHLLTTGYSFEPQVTSKGHASRRGGLLDVWPPTEPWPLRLEFFGSSIDSIRTFDPHEQRSIEHTSGAILSPATEWADKDSTDLKGDLFSYLPNRMNWIWMDPMSIRHHAEVYEETIREGNATRSTHRTTNVRSLAKQHRGNGALSIGPDENANLTTHELLLRPVAGVPAFPAGTATPVQFERERERFLNDLGQRRKHGARVIFYFSTEGVRDRFVEQHGTFSHLLKNAPIHVGVLSEGLTIPSHDLTILTDHDIYGRRKSLRGRYDLHAQRTGPTRMNRRRVEEWTDLKLGELIVHVEHGVGKYLGMLEQEFHGQRQEVLAIEYDQGSKLYIPVSQSQLLTRYVGVGGNTPRLHRMGGRRWTHEKEHAEKSIRDLASSMLETQAHRELREGFAFAGDSGWQHEFEAAFPFLETPDQHQAIADVKFDMEKLRPMDRLVCGDVGYGKTEVAMRAAFKAVMNGKQVAMLVPTTILVQQHFDTFSARMDAFPIAIEALSRFQTRGGQRDIVQRLKEGSVDIVIGTHRLLQNDIAFKDLGLLIIDEEQRFGVEQKETIKHIRQLVDVLTLTATPIPRTLYMSLLGAKEMSTIQSPPQARLPVDTSVAPYSDEIVRKAILTELSREGQVFYLHNRVQTIERIAERLKKLVPEARIGVGHGQMSEKELSGVMRQFVEGSLDVLLCTTIIESGVDIPNANTIIIDRADRFGLSELYQLRGRVGRYKHKAYAYLLLPRYGRLLDTAKKRIGALQQYGSLGAGFKLALKDLEIRGTGNLLGSEQSGHISAIGFELYCQFLKRTVASMKGEKVPPLVIVSLQLDFIHFAPSHSESENCAVIPSTYMDDEDVRVHAYRKLATLSSTSEVNLLAEEFRDRFGPVPTPVHRLLKIALLRVLAATREIQAIETRGQKIMMTRNSDFIKDRSRFPRFTCSTPDEKLDELINVVEQAGKPT